MITLPKFRDTKLFEQAALEDMNASLGDDYLTEEEIKYYMSLPPIK